MSASPFAMVDPFAAPFTSKEVIPEPRQRTPQVRLVKGEHDPLDKQLPPLFAGDARLVRWANSHASGMTATLSIVDTTPFMVHPLKGLKAATDSEKLNGQRLFVVLAAKGGALPDDALPLYRGEAILLWWSDDCKDGMKFTLRLREGPDGAGRVHPCDGLPAGKRNGELMQTALWAVEDDESLGDPRATRKRRRFHELTEIQQSHILCRDQAFQAWLGERLNDMFSHEEVAEIRPFIDHDPQKFAEVCIRRWCRIESRAEFGWQNERSQTARARWARLLNAFEEHRWGLAR